MSAQGIARKAPLWSGNAVVQPHSCFLNNGIKVAFVSHLENVAASSRTGEANKTGGVGYAGMPQKSLQIFVLLHFGWIPCKVPSLTAQSISVL